MKSLFKFIKKLIRFGLVVYGALFVIFYFDLDGKALFYWVEPLLCKIYDKRERKDPVKQKYDIFKPKYEYKV